MILFRISLTPSSEASEEWLLAGNPIHEVKSYKYLGIQFQQGPCTWSLELAARRLKCTRAFGLLTHRGLGSEIFNLRQSRLIVLTALLPLFEYGCIAWSHAREGAKLPLLTLWNKICRKTAQVHRFVSAEIVRRVIGIPSLEVRWAFFVARHYHHLLCIPAGRMVGAISRERKIQFDTASPEKLKNFWLQHVFTAFSFLRIGFSPFDEAKVVSYDLAAWDLLLRKRASTIERALCITKAKSIGAPSSVISLLSKVNEVTFDRLNRPIFNLDLRNYTDKLPNALRVMFILLLSNSLPLQSCRDSCRVLRAAGPDSSEECLLCRAAHTGETLEHFLCNCTRLEEPRKKLKLLCTFQSLSAIFAELVTLPPSPFILLREIFMLWCARRDFLFEILDLSPLEKRRFRLGCT
jgi:hypothetical protein